MCPDPPDVSIIIRTKDRPVFLARALDDVLAQSFTNWELVIVNDGGDPGAVDALVAQRPGLGQHRCIVVHHGESRGMEAASNAGVSATSADLVCVHDDDDTWAADFLAVGVEWLRSHPGAIAVTLGTEIVYERLIDGEIVVDSDRREQFGPPEDLVTLFDLLIRNRFVPISLLLRRSTITAIGPFDESLPVVGDWEFHLRLAAHGYVGYLPNPARAFWHQRVDDRAPSGNSVHRDQHQHRAYDRLVRERALRAHVERNGAGDLLYLSKFIDERVAASERHAYEQVQAALHAQQEFNRVIAERLEAELHALRETTRHYSVGATFRRLVNRINPFGRGRRANPAGCGSLRRLGREERIGDN